MKILWANTTFLHPTNRGGQIRTLEMLKRLHATNEVHYTALADPGEEEGIERSKEYCSHVYPVAYRTVNKNSPEFALQLIRGVVSPVPVAVFRRKSAAMAKFLAELLAREKFDSIVCDFLVSSINMPRLDTSVLFQHNVETVIWQRYAETATDPVRKMYFGLQARKMFAYEQRVCRAARHVITVSDVDARQIREMFGIESVTPAPTGVDTAYFHPSVTRDINAEYAADLVFVGSMDYMANVDGVSYFVREILPLIQRRRPGTTFTIVGRKPPAQILAMASDPLIHVTGSVPDVRPYLWNSSISIVPLRVGGGTRLKIYESMAAGAAVVSTTIGAEGLAYEAGRNIEIADGAESFAKTCVDVLEDARRRQAIADAGLHMVRERFSWESVTQEFAGILESCRLT
jgi:glycosyltransferase involved in cell wall biosynthesis